MNVHVRQLARSLGKMGILVDIFTRAHGDEPETMEYLSDCVRGVHLPAGEAEVPLEEMYGYLPRFLEGVEEFQRENGLIYQAVHSHYWLSGWVGQEMARNLNIPHLVTFHTLALVKMQSRAG